MDVVQAHFSWFGVAFDHPADWELVSAGTAGPWRAFFADRRFQRLEVRWRPAAFDPRFRQDVNKNLAETHGPAGTRLTGQPSPWEGLVAREDNGATVTHAGRWLPAESLLVEIMAVWPGRRDPAVENAILSSVRGQDRDGPRLAWEAMGMRAVGETAWTPARFDSRAGDIAWDFVRRDGRRAKVGPTVRRLAMPAYWMRDGLEAWLARQPAVDARELSRTRVAVNGHDGLSLLTSRPARGWNRVRGRQALRRDTAWLCPVEGRVFHVRLEGVAAGGKLDLPGNLVMSCCRAPHFAGASVPAPAVVPVTGGLNSSQVLDAVPHVNGAAQLAREGGETFVSVPRRRSWLHGWPWRALLPVAPVRRLRLDPLGTEVLGLCDGRRDTEVIVEQFAAAHRLSFREALVPVTQYLHILSGRGVVGLAGRPAKGAA